MKQKKIVSMIGMLVVLIGTVFMMTGCPQANTSKTVKPFAVLKSEDGTAILTINTFDKTTNKGTYTLEKGGQTGKGNFEVVNDGGTFKAKITNATFAGIPQFDQTIPFVGKKLTISGIGTFDFKDIL